MAKEKSTTPLYDKHKKIHDLVGRVQDVAEDEHSTGLASYVHEIASQYLHKNKANHGKVSWEEKGDEEHKKFSDTLWDAAADRIAKDYLKLSDAQIKEFKGKKTKDGGSFWEEMIANYMGGMDKDNFWDRVKNESELTIENLLKVYVNNIAGRHINYRTSTLLKKTIKEPEDVDLTASYLATAKKHNKKSMRPIKIPKKFKSIDEAANALVNASQYMPKNYHPDKKDTYE